MFITIHVNWSFIRKGYGTATKKSLFQVTNKQTFKEAAEKLILQLQPARSKSTIDNYRTALRSFLTYAGGSITLDTINNHIIEGYQRWLQERNVIANTRSCYMRSLRAMLNNIAPEGNYDDLFKNVFTGIAQTVKRAISPEDIHRLEELPLKGCRRLCFFRDLFIFSFYAMGMSFVDLAFLKIAQVKDGYIEYERRKTGKQIRVKIVKSMQQIIKRYAREDSEYLFPLLTSDDPRQAMHEYENQRHYYNQALHKLTNMMKKEHCSVVSNLTSRVPRHSWASMANDANIDLPVISKALGHSSVNTTFIYISEIKDRRVEDAQKKY